MLNSKTLITKNGGFINGSAIRQIKVVNEDKSIYIVFTDGTSLMIFSGFDSVSTATSFLLNDLSSRLNVEKNLIDLRNIKHSC